MGGHSLRAGSWFRVPDLEALGSLTLRPVNLGSGLSEHPVR